MNIKISIIIILLAVVLFNKKEQEKLKVQVFQTSAQGNQFEVMELNVQKVQSKDTLILYPKHTFQKITGFGDANVSKSTS